MCARSAASIKRINNNKYYRIFRISNQSINRYIESMPVESHVMQIHRPKPVFRQVPLTNGILYTDKRRSLGDRGYSDRFTSTSTSSSTDAEMPRCNCDDCALRRDAGARGRSVDALRNMNRYSMPRLGVCRCNDDITCDAAGAADGVIVPASENSARDRVAAFKRRRRNRTTGFVASFKFCGSFILVRQ